MRAEPRKSVEEALELILAVCPVLGSETIEARAGSGRTLVAPAVARMDVPRFRAAAMDGYAVASSDTVTATPTHRVDLAIGRPVAAGSASPPLVTRTAIPISTGAPMPQGADCILTRERASLVMRGGGLGLEIDAPLSFGSNVRGVAEDMAAGSEVLASGARLGPDAVAALVACGANRITVQKRPRVAVIPTGSELVEASTALTPASIVDSNGPMVASFLTTLGLNIDCRPIAEDGVEHLERSMQNVLEGDPPDILITTGGVSAGEHDLVRACAEPLGAQVHFHGLAMRPGKPLLFARFPCGTLLFGLPGNPVAAHVALRIFVNHALRQLAGNTAERGELAYCDVEPREGTTLFLRGCSTRNVDGTMHVDTDLDQRSHILSSLVRSDTWLRIEAGGINGMFTAYPKLAPPLR